MAKIDKNLVFAILAIVVLIVLVLVLILSESTITKIIVFITCLLILILNVSSIMPPEYHAERTKRILIYTYFGVISLAFGGRLFSAVFLEYLNKFLDLPFSINLETFNFLMYLAIGIAFISFLLSLYFWGSNTNAAQPESLTINTVDKKNTVDKNTVDIANFDRLVEEREKGFFRLSIEKNGLIFSSTRGFHQLCESEQSHLSAFQSHTFNSTPALAYSGMPAKKSTQPKRRYNRGAPNFPQQVTAKFHNSDKYIAAFIDAQKSNDQENTKTEIAKKILSRVKIQRLSTKNDIIIIAGSIGSGKSTIVSNVVQNLTSKLASQAQGRSKQTLPVECALIDLENIKPPNNEDLEIYFKKHIEKSIVDQIVDQTHLEGKSLKEIIVSSYGKKLVIAFDNLDSAYHDFCAGMLLHGKELDESAVLSLYHPLVFMLISEFSKGRFSQLGASCIFAIREDTLGCFLSGGNPDYGDKSSILDASEIYTVKEPDAKLFSEILLKRMALARDSCKNSETVKLFDKRIKEIRVRSIDYSSVLHVSVQGMRHTINELAKLSYLIDKDDLFMRLFCDVSNLRTFFNVSGQKHYSQINEGITNIFLVNSKYRRAKQISDKNDVDLFDEKHLKDHPHTYWLKYFVLYLMTLEATERGGLIRLFHKTGGYYEPLIELILFSLSEVNHGRLIRPKINVLNGGKVDNLGLELTLRGKPLVDKGYFWKFEYLAMIVEDSWMEFPNIVKPEFIDPIGFKHLGAEGSANYKCALFDFLDQKIVTVFLFLLILEVSLEFESKVRGELISSLRDKGMIFPDFKVVRQECKASIEELATALMGSQREEILGKLKICTSVTFNRKWRRKLRKAMKSSYL